MKRRAHNEPGFVLHAYPYRETSLVVEVLTRRAGRMAMLARGARRPRSSLRGILLAFQPLRLSWSGATELVTLTGAEWAGSATPLAGTGLMCGFYLNELVLKLLAREDPHEALFDAYASSLARLAAGEAHAPVLRAFERRLLAELGYAPLLDREASGAEIEPGRLYRYEPDRGPVAPRGEAGELLVHGRTLLAMSRDDYREAETREEALRLMRMLIEQRLGGQALHTRAVLAELKVL
jgi:DNA repair protein RecO (recombination protein O)